MKPGGTIVLFSQKRQPYHPPSCHHNTPHLDKGVVAMSALLCCTLRMTRIVPNTFMLQKLEHTIIIGCAYVPTFSTLVSQQFTGLSPNQKTKQRFASANFHLGIISTAPLASTKRNYLSSAIEKMPCLLPVKKQK